MGQTDPGTYTTQAICLKTVNYGEADKIVTLYSPQWGKISAIAKGVKRQKSKLSGVCELLSVNEVQLARGKSLDVVCQYQSLALFPSIREDILKLAYATLFAELVNLLATEHDADSHQIFSLLANGLGQLEYTASEQILPIATQFQVQLLHAAGYHPSWYQCVVCSEELSITQEAVYQVFSANLGGLLCHDCRDQTPNATCVKISTSTLTVLNKPLESGWDKANGLKVQQFLRYFFSHKLEKKIQAYEFVLQLLDVPSNS